MTEHKIFDIIWVARKTHAQLVERSSDVWRLLLKEKLLTDDHLSMFWELTKAQDFKSSVYKIISDSSFYLQQPQIEFMFKEITQTPAQKLDM